MQPRAALLALVLVVLPGCPDERLPSAHPTHTPEWSVDVLGYRGVDVRGGRRLVFDAEKPPLIRVCPASKADALPAPSAVSVRWRAADEARATPGAGYMLGRCLFVETTWPSQPVIGPGEVDVGIAGLMLRLPARWDYGPQAHPSIVPFVGRRKEASNDGASAQAATFERLFVEIGSLLTVAPPGDRPWLLAEQARLAWRLDRRAEAIETMTAAADAALEIELPWFAADCLQVAIYYAMHTRDSAAPVRAQSLIERLVSVIDRTNDPQQRVNARYLQARSRAENGLLLAARRLLEDGAQKAMELGDRSSMVSIADLESAVLGALGRGDEALERGRVIESHVAALAAAVPPAMIVQLRQNTQWIRMELVEAGRLPRSEIASVRAALAALVSVHPTPAGQANLAVDQARAALMDGDRPAAAAHIAEARALSDDGGGVDPEYVDLLEAEIGLGSESPQWILARLAGRPPSLGSPHCDRHRGWALAIEARARQAAGETTEALRLARAAVEHAIEAPVPHGIEQGRAMWLPVVATAVELALTLEGPEAAWRVVDDMHRHAMVGSLTRHRLGRLDRAELPIWANGLARIEQACRERRTGGQDAETLAVDLRQWLASITGGPSPAEAAGPVDRLIESGDALLTRVLLGRQWHGFRITGGQVEHRLLPDARLPSDWLSSGRHRYLVDPPHLPPDAEVTAALDLSWLSHAGALRASVQAPDGQAPLVLEPSCPLDPVDPWAVHVRRADTPPASARAIGALAPSEGAPVAIIVPCGAFDPTAAMHVAHALVSSGTWATLVATEPASPEAVPGLIKRLVEAGVTRDPARATRQMGGWRLVGRADPPRPIR